MKKRISVTRRDIYEGLRHDVDRNPVCRAINRHLRPDCSARVMSTGIRVGFNNTACRVVPVRSGIMKFLAMFDAGFNIDTELSPFNFPLDIPDEYLKARG